MSKESASYNIITDPEVIEKLEKEKKINSWLCDSDDPIAFVLNWNGINYMFSATEEEISNLKAGISDIQKERMAKGDVLLAFALRSLPLNPIIYNALRADILPKKQK